MPTHDRHRRRRRRDDDDDDDDGHRERRSRDRRRGDHDRRRRRGQDDDIDEVLDDDKPTLTPAAPGPSTTEAPVTAAHTAGLHADPRRRSRANLPGPKRRAEVVSSSSSDDDDDDNDGDDNDKIADKEEAVAKADAAAAGASKDAGPAAEADGGAGDASSKDGGGHHPAEAAKSEPPAAADAYECQVCGRRVGGGQAGHYQHVRSAFHLTWQLWNSGKFDKWQQAKAKGQEMSAALWKSKDAMYPGPQKHGKDDAKKAKRQKADTPPPPPRAQVDRFDDKGPDPDGDSEALLCKMWLATVRALSK